MEIKILGPGCINCHTLEQLAKTAIAALGIEARIEHVSDIKEFMKYHMMSTPGLVVNGKLKHSGKPLPDIEKVKTLIKEEA